MEVPGMGTHDQPLRGRIRVEVGKIGIPFRKKQIGPMERGHQNPPTGRRIDRVVRQKQIVDVRVCVLHIGLVSGKTLGGSGVRKRIKLNGGRCRGIVLRWRTVVDRKQRQPRWIGWVQHRVGLPITVHVELNEVTRPTKSICIIIDVCRRDPGPVMRQHIRRLQLAIRAIA